MSPKESQSTQPQTDSTSRGREETTRQERLTLRQQMLDQGEQPYPQDGHRTHTNAEALAEREGAAMVVSGRVVASRGHGRIRFYDIRDESGTLQVVCKKNTTERFVDLKRFDIGDFMLIIGTKMTTESGQPSVLADEAIMASKSIRPLPDRPFQNEEARYRRRSVDLLTRPEAVEVFRKRTAIINSVRHTLSNYGFLEVDTPILQPLYGGANARPFLTHINAYDMPMYLRISPELYLKHLIIGGIDRVYEIAKNFRNEGVDRTHNPEFSMMECYAAYWDYEDMMNLTEELYQKACLAANGTDQIEYQGTTLDFSQKWRRLTMSDAIHEYLGLRVEDLTDDQLKQAITHHGGVYEGDWIRGLGIATLFEAVEDQLIQPTFITDFPRETTSLCKPHRQNPQLIERFEPYISGWEIGNAYTELNDPILQRQFWEEERAGDPQAHPLDESFISSLEQGMPPTGGLGLGIDRMVMLLTNQTKIRDVIFFPIMKPDQR